MTITKLFYFDLSGKTICQKILRSNNFNQKLHRQLVEAEAVKEEAAEAEELSVEAKTIQKLLLPHLCFKPALIRCH